MFSNISDFRSCFGLCARMIVLEQVITQTAFYKMCKIHYTLNLPNSLQTRDPMWRWWKEIILQTWLTKTVEKFSSGLLLWKCDNCW